MRCERDRDSDDETSKEFGRPRNREIEGQREPPGGLGAVGISDAETRGPVGRGRSREGHDARGTLKVWDLDAGRELATLRGHAFWVIACAVTPDGRRVISASHDKTLRVWDLETGACLLTHRSNAAFSAVTATATTIIAGDATGAVWFLDWPPQLVHVTAEPAIEPTAVRTP